MTVLSILLECTFRQNQFSTQKEDWVENPKSMEADSKRKAGGPSKSVIYFKLLSIWSIMPVYAPMLEVTYYDASIIR